MVGILFLRKNMEFFAKAKKRNKIQKRIECYHKKFMEDVLIEVCHSFFLIYCTSPLPKGKYPPPWKRIGRNSNIVKSRFRENLPNSDWTKHINMKWYPTLGCIFSPNLHLETLSIWYTNLDFSTLLKKIMGFYEKFFRIICMLKNMKCLKFIKCCLWKR